MGCPLFLLPVSARAETILLAGGGRTRAEAEAALAALVVPSALVLGAPPRVVRSDDVAGLRPGFHVVVVGQCADAARAAAALDVLRVSVPGAYVREVERTSAADECPRVLGAPGEPPARATDRAPVRAGVAAVEWLVFDGASGPGGCDATAVTEVQRAGVALARREDASSCVAPGGPDDLGSSTTPSHHLVAAGDVTFLIVEERSWVADHPSMRAALYAYCGDGIREVLALPWSTGAVLAGIAPSAPQPDPARPRFRVDEGGDPVGPVLHFLPERCVVEVVPSAGSR